VASVEEILQTAASRFPGPARPSEGRPLVEHALWIRACVTMDDAPTWLIYDTGDDGVAWSRVPDGVEPLDLVEARRRAGGHADPLDVLLWLQGEIPEPWGGGGDGGGDVAVVRELERKIRRR
jgi:hypothetical protein